MPGIPRSQRCNGCRHRKIKCDQNWPTCTPCARKNVACSGPSTAAKFVHSNHLDAPSASASSHSSFTIQGTVSKSKGQTLQAPSSRSSDAPKYSMISVNSLSVDGGASYGCFRLSPGPRSVPTTVADRVAVRLSALLDRGTYDSSAFSMSYMKLVPKRLSSSAALRDTTALMCSAWTNSRRKLPVDELVALGIYGKALRSLQRALSGPQQLDCETLAAVSIMERFIVLFNRGNRRNRILHAQGIHTLMEQRGAPDLDDELDVLLTIENQQAMLAYSVLCGVDNIYCQPIWKDALARARDTLPQDDEDPTVLIMDSCYAQWPTLVKEMRVLYISPHLAGHKDRVKATLQKIQALKIDSESRIPQYTAKMHAQGHIKEVNADANCPVPRRYECSHPDYAEIDMGCHALRIILNRMLFELLTVFDADADDVDGDLPTPAELDEENRHTSQQVVKFVPYLLEIGSVAGGLLTTPVHLAIEGADSPSKEYLIDFLIEVNLTQHLFPKGIACMEDYLIDRARVLTGRQPTRGTLGAMSEADIES